MKFKGLCIALLFIFTFGFSSTVLGVPVQPYTPSEIRIIESNTNLKVGDFGYIKIKGTPETRYVLSTTYQREDGDIRVEQVRVTDRNGEATFNWIVENETIIGTHSAIIAGGGTSLTVNHSVTQ